MQIMEVDAASDKDALKTASEVLCISSDEIDVHLHKKGGGGFLGIGGKNPSVYRVFAIKDKTPKEAILRGTVTSLAEKMGFQVKVQKIEKGDEGKTYIHISSDEAGYVIGKKGKTLEAIQFMVNLMVQQFTGEPPKILLDIENYRERRANYLTDIAIKLAESVKKTKRSKLMEPLNPYERRIIHMALQEDEVVETESEGTGTYKRVRIRLKNGGSEGKPMDDESQENMLPHEEDHDGDDELYDEMPDSSENPENEYDNKQPDHYNSVTVIEDDSTDFTHSIIG